MATQQQDFIVKNGMVVRNTATISTIDNFVGTSTNIIVSQPTLNLDFTKGVLDPRITFTRASGATYVGQDGFIKYANPNQPRFDYDPANTGTALGLLMEDQRTNMYRWATTITTATWTPGAFFNVPLKENALQSPDGAYNAPILFNTPNVSSLITPSRDAFNTNTYYTKSIYVKYLYGWNHIYFQSILSDGTTSVIDFDIQNGIVQSAGYGSSTGTSSITSVGNGWYRCVSTFLTLTTGTTIGDVFYIAGYGSSNLPSAMGVWGAQCEASAFATSIIPTTSAAATRAAESATIAGSSFNNFINQVQGTLYFEGSLFQKRLLSGTGFPRMLSLIGNDQQNYEISIYTREGISDPTYGWFFAAAINNATGFDRVAGVTQTVLNTGKAVFRYNLTNPQMYANGVSIVNPSPPSILPTTVAMSIMGQVRYQNMPFGRVRRVMYWNSGLTDAQLSYLSSATIYTGNNFANVDNPVARTANTSNFVVQQGVQVRGNLEVPDVDKLYVTTLTRPTQQPSLNLNFLKGQLDPRIQFTRSSGATYVGADGYIKYVNADQPRFNYSTTSTGTCLGLLMEEQRTNFFLNNASYSGGIFVKGGGTAIAPDGNRADLYTVSASTATSYPGNGTSNSTFSIGIGSTIDYTFSGYIGPSYGTQQLEPHIVIDFSTNVSTNFSYVELQINTTNWTVRQNNLPNGLGVTQVTAPIITQAQGGMYKVTWTVRYTQDGTGRNTARGYFQIRNTALSGVYATDGTCQVQVACMQLEQGSFPTSYIPTGSTAATRANDLASMSGSNFNNWYNPLVGSLIVKYDNITTIPNSTGGANAFPDVILMNTARGNVFWASYSAAAGTSGYTGSADNYWGFSGMKTRVGISWSSTASYVVCDAVNSQTFGTTIIPFPNTLYIGNGGGSNVMNGHMRQIAYYNSQLPPAQLQVLTSY